MKYLILAGPQAAGKSTTKDAVKTVNYSITTLQEARQIVVRSRERKGAIFMSKEDELNAIHLDFQRMFHILDNHRDSQIYVDETNVFTLGHALAHGIDLVDGYFKQYCDLLQALNAVVLFIDVPVEISWSRRKPRYIERLRGYPDADVQATLALHRKYLDRLHPELLKIYNRLTCRKACIDGSQSREDTTRNVIKSLRDFFGETTSLLNEESLDQPPCDFDAIQQPMTAVEPLPNEASREFLRSQE